MRGRVKKTGAFAALGVLFFLVASFEQSLAQGLGGLEQFLGGSSGQRRQYSGHASTGQPNNAVTVERNTAPFVGKFSGKQKAPSYEGDLNANFACYPALDGALPNNRTFVCYTAEEQPRVPE
jgi:hypothetical protein